MDMPISNMTDQRKNTTKREVFATNNFGFTSLKSDGSFGSNGLSTIINASGIFFSAGNEGTSVSNTIKPGQSISFTNGVITLTNSTGVFVGTSMENLKKLSDNPKPNNFVDLTNVGPNQSVSVTNGIVTLTNSTGVYVGTSIESLVKFV